MTATYPAKCVRSGCDHDQAQHDPSVNTAHPCLESGCSCDEYVFPEGVSPYYPVLPSCGGCARTVYDHELIAPHGSTVVDGSPVCEGYVFPPNREQSSYTGGGGGFGGGGASGGW
jgi:hypothetical protein